MFFITAVLIASTQAPLATGPLATLDLRPGEGEVLPEGPHAAQGMPGTPLVVVTAEAVSVATSLHTSAVRLVQTAPMLPESPVWRIAELEEWVALLHSPGAKRANETAPPAAKVTTVFVAIERRAPAWLVRQVLFTLGNAGCRVLEIVRSKDGLRAVPAPTVKQGDGLGSPGPINVATGLSKERMAAVMSEARPKIQGCVRPELKGNAKAHFVIGADGVVVSAVVESVELKQTALPDCIAKVLWGLRFPASTFGGPTTVDYPFVFGAKR